MTERGPSPIARSKRTLWSLTVNHGRNEWERVPRLSEKCKDFGSQKWDQEVLQCLKLPDPGIYCGDRSVRLTNGQVRKLVVVVASQAMVWFGSNKWVVCNMCRRLVIGRWRETLHLVNMAWLHSLVQVATCTCFWLCIYLGYRSVESYDFRHTKYQRTGCSNMIL